VANPLFKNQKLALKLLQKKLFDSYNIAVFDVICTINKNKISFCS